MTTHASLKSHWACPGECASGHEHFSGLAKTLPDVVLDYRVLAREPVLISQAVTDTLGRVRLLLRQRLIVLQDPVNHSLVRVELRSAWWLFPRVPGRQGVLQHLVDRNAVQNEHPGRLLDAHSFNGVGPTNSLVQIHDVHPPLSHPMLTLSLGRRPGAVQF